MWEAVEETTVKNAFEKSEIIAENSKINGNEVEGCKSGNNTSVLSENFLNYVILMLTILNLQVLIQNAIFKALKIFFS